MTGSAILNGLLGLATVLTFAFSIQSTNYLLDSPIKYPFIAGFHVATESLGLTTAATVVVILLIFGSSLSVLATASRHVVSFSRDEGLPLPHLWTAVIPVGTEEPLNALFLCFAVTVILALLHLGIESALDLSASLFVSALLFSYFVAIFCALLYRIRSDQPVGRLWTLGQLSIPASIFALMYIVFVFAMSFFPVSRSGLSPTTMNWNAVVWMAAILFATVLYAVHGRYVFKGPSGMFSRSLEDLSSSLPTIDI
jgi:choline transport protein